MFKKILSKIKEYLAYPSTSKGLVFALGLVGYTIEPAALESILYTVGSIVALLEVFTSDADVITKKKK